MSPFWSWLSNRKNGNKRNKKVKHNQPGHRRIQTENLSRNTGASTWGEQTWELRDTYPFTTGPPRHHNTSRIPDVLGAGSSHVAGSGTRESNQWIIRDRKASGTSPGTNILNVSDKHSENMKTIYPPEAVLPKDYPSSHHHMTPPTSVFIMERLHDSPTPQAERQLVAFQQHHSPGVRGTPSRPTSSHYHPDIDQPQPLDGENDVGYLMRERQNRDIVNNHMLLHSIPQQDAPGYDFSHKRFESQTTQNELAFINKRKIDGGRMSQPQTVHNTSIYQEAEHQIPQPSSQNPEHFSDKTNRIVTAQESIHDFVKSPVQKLYPWQEMYEIRRPGERLNRIVYNYIPKALDQQDVSSLLCGGNIDQLSSAATTDFKANLLNDRARYQQRMRDSTHIYPVGDIQVPPKPDYTHGSSTPDYIHKYPLVQEPPMSDFNHGSVTPDYIQKYKLRDIQDPPKPANNQSSTTPAYIQRYSLIQEPVPDYSDGATTPDHTQQLSPGHAHNPQASDNYPRKTSSRTVTPKYNENFNLLSVQSANNPGQEIPMTGDTDIPSNNNRHFYSDTSANRKTSLKSLEDAELLKLRGRFSGFSKAPYADTKSRSYGDAGNDDNNVKITHIYNGSFSATSGRINTRFDRNDRMASGTALDDYNEDDVNSALNQLDDATISETERDLVRELECIFQTEGEVLY